MEPRIKNLFLLAVLLAGLGLPAGHVTAQTFTVLRSFSQGNTNSLQNYTNSDGANPAAGLVLSGNTLYGTAQLGGNRANGNGVTDFGTVFAVKTDGTGFTVLHYFNGNDGFYPAADLILSGNTLYGTTGYSPAGTVFKISTTGGGFTTLANASSGNNYG